MCAFPAFKLQSGPNRGAEAAFEPIVLQEPAASSLPRRCHVHAPSLAQCPPAATCKMDEPAGTQLAHVAFRCDHSMASPLQHPGDAPPEDVLVPNIVHWVSPGLDGEPFPYWAHLNLAAVIDVLRPEVFYFHHVEGCLPSGRWWDAAAPLLTLVSTPPVEQVYGNPVRLLAHRADVMRLVALAHMGGIYLDSDVLPLRSFAPLMRNAFVIGMQSTERTANAVLLAARGAPFTLRWLDAYHNFSDADWDGHSVRLPFALAQAHPGDALWLPRTAWFAPGPDDDPGYELFERRISEDDPMLHDGSVPFAHHLWHQITRPQLDQVTGPKWFHAHLHTLYARKLMRMAASGDCPRIAAALALHDGE